MTITFTFVVFCQTDLPDHCGGGPKLDKFMTLVKNDNLLAQLKTEPGFGEKKLKLLEFDVYARRNRGLGDLGVPTDLDRYGRPVFVGMAEGDIMEGALTAVATMDAFRSFLVEIFKSEIGIDADGEPETYLDFPEPVEFSWVVFRVQDKADYQTNFRKYVGPGHGN